MYLVKTPKFIQNLFPNYIWSIPTSEKVMYLTFDDGPIPEVTPWVMETLARYEAKATFFCVGENVERHTSLFKELQAQGHSVGNHTHSHLNGWSSENLPYFHNVRNCATLVESDLFRPPYGRLRPKQAQFLQRHYRIIMWDVLSGDFDHRITGEQVLGNVVMKSGPGSVVVFHDSLKAEKNLRYALPRVLEHFSSQGFRFEALAQNESQVGISKAS
ncbi:MAG: polysaccharide deacetylase family protein [Saprospiraceae bacterium]|nr:polysaccharide deacetylase family protein [Saprospiraceae bacterium]